MQISVANAFVYGLKGGGMAAVINLGMFLLARYVLGVSFDVVMGGEDNMVTWWQVLAASLLPALAAACLYYWLVKKATNAKKIFRGIAGVVLLLSFYTPVTAAPAVATKVVLSLMHIVAAFEITKSLTHDLPVSSSERADSNVPKDPQSA